MLNALIAIMSNSYEEIQRTVELEQLKAKWNMLGEMSYLVHNIKMFWKACVRRCRRSALHPMAVRSAFRLNALRDPLARVAPRPGTPHARDIPRKVTVEWNKQKSRRALALAVIIPFGGTAAFFFGRTRLFIASCARGPLHFRMHFR